MSSLRLWTSLGILILLLTACTQYPETCFSSTPVGLASAAEIASDDSLPFRFPLDESPIDDTLYFGWFGVSNECTPDVVGGCYKYPERKFHAAEDYKRPAGTPVYAMADGTISFSGPASGYGWLIIIDHPQANLYSLYGHLSPSRWKLAARTEVERGDLIAYLGDSNENGGSDDQPVDTHLHFGIRAGQRTNYPGMGEWRWNGGWIKLCPQELGWLQPSEIITRQEIPLGGFPEPSANLLEKWGIELAFIGVYVFGGIFALVSAFKKNTPIVLVVFGGFVIAAGWVLSSKGTRISSVLFPMAVLALGVAAFQYRCLQKSATVHQGG